MHSALRRALLITALVAQIAPPVWADTFPSSERRSHLPSEALGRAKAVHCRTPADVPSMHVSAVEVSSTPTRTSTPP